MGTFQMWRYQVLLLCSIILLSSFCRSEARRFDQIPLSRGAIGPESIAFDCHGRGPYVGVSDGRILRREGLPSFRWKNFAVMPNWSRSCFGVSTSQNTTYCGRPLGLKFHPKTCELYVADAYHGLVVVGQQGGRGISVAKGAEGIPFKFTNSLDIDQDSGVVYFTDTSARFEQWEAGKSLDTGDNTGRLMIYNPKNRKVKVLLNHLRFANGVALSRNKEFLLVSESTTGQVRRLWLQGPKYNTSDVFLYLQGHPDNIHRDLDGNFWIAQWPVNPPLNSNQSAGDEGVPINIDEEGHILERLDGKRASDVMEFGGKLWIGSVSNSYIEVA